MNANQTVEIVLVGDLHKKTSLEKVMSQVGDKPFDEVMRALLKIINNRG
jgi:hypothetical protein